MTTVKAKDARELVQLVGNMRKSEEYYKETRLTRHNIEYREYQQKVDRLLRWINSYQ